MGRQISVTVGYTPGNEPPPDDEWPNATNTGPAAAGYSLTTWSGSIIFTTDDQVITGKRFQGDLPTVQADRVIFKGCEFRSSDEFFMIRLDGLDAVFEDCEFRPDVTNTVPVALNQSYQQAIKIFDGTGCRVSRCNIWGFGNGFEFLESSSSQTHPIIFEDNYVHDAADQGGDSYHHDGFGPGNPTSYITIHHNYIVSGGNTNALALQANHQSGIEGVYDHLTITDNKVGGFGYTVNLNDDDVCSNVVFTGNVFTTLIEPNFGPFKNDWAGFTGTNVWSNNKWEVPAGAEYGDPSWDGLYWWPTDGKTTGGHATDFAG